MKDFKVTFQGRQFDCLDKGFAKDEPVDIVIRPEDIKVVAAGSGMLPGKVSSVTFKGVHYEMMIDSQDYTWMVHSTVMAPVDSIVGLNIYPNDIHIMKKRRGE
jgi:spermidine/putrescine transport system ATP-binding protein